MSSTLLTICLVERFSLGAMFFFLLSVAERTFKQVREGFGRVILRRNYSRRSHTRGENSRGELLEARHSKDHALQFPFCRWPRQGKNGGMSFLGRWASSTHRYIAFLGALAACARSRLTKRQNALEGWKFAPEPGRLKNLSYCFRPICGYSIHHLNFKKKNVMRDFVTKLICSLSKCKKENTLVACSVECSPSTTMLWKVQNRSCVVRYVGSVLT